MAIKKLVTVSVGQVNRNQYGSILTVLRVDELLDSVEYLAENPSWETPHKSGHELSLFQQFVFDRHYVRVRGGSVDEKDVATYDMRYPYVDQYPYPDVMIEAEDEDGPTYDDDDAYRQELKREEDERERDYYDEFCLNQD